MHFYIDPSDLLVVITINRNPSKENVTNLVGKMVIFGDSIGVNLDDLSVILSIMNINELNIFNIGGREGMEIIKTKGPSTVNLFDISVEKFIEFLNMDDFMEYNKNSLYILKNSNYINAKQLFTKINGCNTNLGRGGSQKSHIVSPLELRLNSYLMGIFKFDIKKISSLNAFNFLPKNRYLPFVKNFHEKKNLE